MVARTRRERPSSGDEHGSEHPGEVLVHLVPMRRRHLRSVMRIESSVYPRPWSMALFVSELALRGARAYYVAKVNGTVAGYSGLMLNVDDAHITTIAVDPAWQRHHVATRLLLTMAHIARARGANQLSLEVRVSNRSAQSLYYKFGFRPVGIRRNYYAETNEDALIMTVDDITTRAYADRLSWLARDLLEATVVDGAKWA